MQSSQASTGHCQRPLASIRAGIILALLCLLSSGPWGCAALQNPQAVLTRLEPNETLPASWRVSGGRGAELLILGSIHLGPPTGWLYPPGVIRAFEDSEALVVELDPDDIAPSSWQFLINYYGNLPRGRSLRRMIDSKTWDLLETVLDDSGLPIQSAERMRPWLIGNLLASEATRELGYSSREGTDRHFIRYAGERSVISLETASNLLSKMASLPFETQKLVLLDTLVHHDEAHSFVEQLIDAWRAGDERGLEKLIFDSQIADTDFQPLFEAMFFQRNREMASHLRVLLDAEQHSGETVFVVLGVGHLIGDQGIPAILKSKNYRVERNSRRKMEKSPERGGEIAIDS